MHKEIKTGLLNSLNLRKAVAILLSVLMLCLVSACESVGTEPNNQMISSKPGSTGDNKDDSNDEGDSTSSGNLNDKLNGEISVEEQSLTNEKNSKKYVRRDELIINNNTGTPIKSVIDSQIKSRRNEILNSGNTEDYYKITGKKIYVSENGDDENDGLTPKTAVKNIFAAELLSPGPGDAILFERGSEFRISEPINAIPGVTYGSYGEGEKPAIYASPKNYAIKTFWAPTRKKNVWVANYGYDDPGCIVFNWGEDAGIRKANGLEQLIANGQFYHNKLDSLLYLYCDKGNPGEVYDDIEICANLAIFYIDAGFSDITIDNLALKYSAAGAVWGWFYPKGLTVTNCEMAWIGGNASSGQIRAGNAVQIWDGATNCKVDNNWIYQVFDTAISWQGDNGHDYKNISFSGNLIEYCAVGIEIWDHNKQNKDCKIENFVCNDNIISAIGYGWGNRKNDAGFRGIEGIISGSASNLGHFDMTMKNNVFDCSYSKFIHFKNSGFDGVKRKANISGNTYYQRYTDYSSTLTDFEFQGQAVRITSQKIFEDAVRQFDSSPKKIEFLG